MTRGRFSPALVLTAALLLALVSGCDRISERIKQVRESFEERSKAAQAEREQKVAFKDDVGTVFAINTTKAVSGQLLDYLELNGDVVTRTNVVVFADTSGKLTKLNVRLGQYVVKDQVIAEIDPSRPGMTFVASPVKSPIAGTVIEIPAQIGATISPAVPIAKVSKTTDVQIMTFISERFISKVRLRLKALLRFEAYPDERFQAWVSEISPVVDPQSRTLEIRLNLNRLDRRIKPGMFAEVKIIIEKKEGIVKIPADCLVKRYGGYYVFVVKDGTEVEKRKVTPGIEIDSKLEIVEGLAPDEEIVIRGQTLLEDKAKVKVIERVQPLASEDIME